MTEIVRQMPVVMDAYVCTNEKAAYEGGLDLKVDMIYVTNKSGSEDDETRRFQPGKAETAYTIRTWNWAEDQTAS